jgi:ABC-type multidrug transport system ATPase subunit
MHSPLDAGTPRPPLRDVGVIDTSLPAPPAITVVMGDWRRTFTAGQEVVIGRDVRADVRVAHPGVSRVHVLLRYVDGHWAAIDNQSTNGMFVDGCRVYSVELRSGATLRVGNPEGPPLTFELRPQAPPADDRPTAPTPQVSERRTEVLQLAGGRGRSQPAATEPGGLEVRGLCATIEGCTLLDRVSYSAGPATLTAVIGPSGSGKSTLSKLVAGASRPAAGTVSFEGHDVHRDYVSLRSRIGMVPQEDVIHRLLTIEQALGYAAELRMPPHTTEQERQRVIAKVLEEMELTPHAQTRVDKLSGGQRKRVSVAMELLTGPSLLVLDEPTTGLDPALDRQVMTMLRALADAGRVVVVVTHSLDYLDVCDQVLLLAPGGRTAFCGPPDELGQAMGSTDWADVFTALEADPQGAQRRFLERDERPLPHTPASSSTAADKPVRTDLLRQVRTLARRQVRLLVADRRYALFLALLPLLVGLLPLAVAGHVGFHQTDPNGIAPFEPKQLVVLLNLGGLFMGTALTIRDLVGERGVFRREQAAGLSTTAYVMAKIVVFGVAAVLQSALLVLIVTAPKIGKSAPSTAAALGSPVLELFAGVAATCVASAMLGLAVSTLAHNNNQVLPLMAVTLTAQLVLAGGFIPVTGTTLLDPLSWFTPARWGLAATASTADLSNLVNGVPRDAHWRHTAAAWYFDVAMLGLLSVCYACFVRWRLRLEAGSGRA